MIKLKHLAAALVIAISSVVATGAPASAATCNSSTMRTLKQSENIEFGGWQRRSTTNNQPVGSGYVEATVDLYYANCGTAYRKVRPLAIVVCLISVEQNDPYFTGLSPSLTARDANYALSVVDSYLAAWSQAAPALYESGCSTYSNLTQQTNANGDLWWYFTPDTPEWSVVIEPNASQGTSFYYRPTTYPQLFNLKKSVVVEDWF